MARIVQISTLVCFLFAATSACETEPIIFKGPFHVRFTEGSGFEKESNSSINR